MGMFDTVWVRCQCGERLGFQSKGGPCNLDDYTLADAPTRILGDIDGDSQRCRKCGTLATIRVACMATIDFGEPAAPDEEP